LGTIKEIKRRRKGHAFLHDYTDHHGKRHRETLEVKTRKEAEEIASMVEARVAEIKRGLRSPPQAKTEWKDFKRRVLNHYEQHKAWRTTMRMRDALRNVERVVKKEYLQDISLDDIEEFKAKRLKKVRPSTVSIELRGLKAAFNLAIRWQMMSSNPVIGISLPKGNDYKVRRLNNREVESLLSVVDNQDYKDLIQAYLHTGARRSELLSPNFEWVNVDWEEKRLTLLGKGDRVRWIPMNETMEAILLRRKNSGKVPPFDFRPDTVTHAVRRYLSDAKIEGASVHTLRKTFGSRLLESKAADIYTVSQLLGHSSVIVTERHYIDLIDENYHKAVRSLDSTENNSQDRSTK